MFVFVSGEACDFQGSFFFQYVHLLFLIVVEFRFSNLCLVVKLKENVISCHLLHFFVNKTRQQLYLCLRVRGFRFDLVWWWWWLSFCLVLDGDGVARDGGGSLFGVDGCWVVKNLGFFVGDETNLGFLLRWQFFLVRLSVVIDCCLVVTDFFLFNEDFCC
ncbi:hypothetical protein Dsin_026459 [Dipteronia sinensis]|uniref:Transmembrane protein n=1 Tax=Dipteronia sinensis TaxID=43782 RepID=A0AAD9ZYR1_9ROSI|nr:hypothetical protein Dsin_026459 [Dipteronia sinensis]